jgi:hypothetical protein
MSPDAAFQMALQIAYRLCDKKPMEGPVATYETVGLTRYLKGIITKPLFHVVSTSGILNFWNFELLEFYFEVSFLSGKDARNAVVSFQTRVRPW